MQQSSSDDGYLNQDNLRRNEYSPLQFFGHDGFVDPATNVTSPQFLLNLLFGTRGVEVPVSLDMAVDSLMDIAAGIAQLDTGMVILRFGTVVMQPGMFLRNYLSRADHQGATVTVVSRMSSPRVTTPRAITFPPGAPTAPQGITSPIMQSERSGTPPSPAHLFTDPMYSINLVYEDGHTISQIVWLGMTIPNCARLWQHHSVCLLKGFSLPVTDNLWLLGAHLALLLQS
jgi:hypothetical protein